MRILKATLAVVLGFALGPLALAQQQPPPPKPEEKKPPKKARKVWTQDDVARLRTPSDEYADKKAAEEAAAKAEAAKATTEKEAAAAVAGQVPADGTQPPPEQDFLPKTLEDADARIAEKNEEIRFQSERIADFRTQYFAASGEERERLQKKVEEETKLLEDAQAELKLLEGRRAELSAKPAGAAAPPQAPTVPPPAPPRPPQS